MAIFGVDLIQRGFGVFAKADLLPNLQQALSIYFIVISFGVLLSGFLCDKINSKYLMLIATICGGIGIIALPHSPWAFGLIFGSAASIIKLAPFTGPLKLYDGKDAKRVCPQAAAKNVSASLFILFIGTLFSSLGWTISTIILAGIFVLSGFLSFKALPKDKIEGWKISIFIKLAKQWKFWMISTYFFLMCGWYYLAISGFYPVMTNDFGMEAGYAMTIIAISYLFAGASRWVVSWIGDQKITLSIPTNFSGAFGQGTGFWVYKNKVPITFKLRLPLMWLGTFGMASCILLTPIHPIWSLILFTFMSAIHTPNYWSYCKEQWGPLYISTLVAIGSFFMYLGAGVMYSDWLW
jgi:hypothetical protein